MTFCYLEKNLVFLADFTKRLAMLVNRNLFREEEIIKNSGNIIWPEIKVFLENNMKYFPEVGFKNRLCRERSNEHGVFAVSCFES